MPPILRLVDMGGTQEAMVTHTDKGARQTTTYP
jgi:hypothetical protein